MLPKLTAIAGKTFLETIRQPIYSILIWVAVFWVAFVNPSMASFSLTIGNDIKIFNDVGLATLMLYGLLAAVFSASSVITREIESQTVLTVIAKPVSRPLFFVGKYLGVTGAILLGYYLVTLTFFLAARQGVFETVSDEWDLPVWTLGTTAIGIAVLVGAFGNYVYGWNFLTTLTLWVTPLLTVALGLVLFFDHNWQPQPPSTDFGDLQLVYGVVMIFLSVLILAAFAVALSTRFGQIITLTLCTAILWLGLTSDHYFGQHVGEGLHYRVMYGVLPNFQVFWIGDALTQELLVPASFVAQTASYAALYTLAVLGLGVALFQAREVG